MALARAEDVERLRVRGSFARRGSAEFFQVRKADWNTKPRAFLFKEAREIHNRSSYTISLEHRLVARNILKPAETLRNCNVDSMFLLRSRNQYLEMGR